MCVCVPSVDIDSIECIRDPSLESTVSPYPAIDWYALKSPESQLSKTFCGLKYHLNINKVMSRNVWMCFVSTVRRHR